MSAIAPVSDLRLKELAEEPASDLFPALSAGASFNPWLVLLAFIPCLPGILAWTLDERSAGWGLQALSIARGADLSRTATAGDEFADNDLTAAPALASWLTAMTLSVWPQQMPWGLMLVSYLSVAGTILTAARLGRRFGIDRLAYLTAICCTGCPLFLNSAHFAGPGALGLFFLTVALERFLAHLDMSVGAWSRRLFAAGVAWGGSLLAIGWAALPLGVALAIHALIFSDRRGEGSTLSQFSRQTPMRKFRRSAIVFCIIGLLTGGWSLWNDVRRFGLAATTAWLLDPVPHAASPLYPDAEKIAAWGGGAGLAFFWGWIVLGCVALLSGQSRSRMAAGDGRGVALLVWWAALIICRVTIATVGGDPTLWDVFQTVPACLIAAIGMETVIERRARPVWLAAAVLVALGSLALFVPMIQTISIRSAFAVGTAICLTPIIRNLWEARSYRWSELQLRRALRGLVVGTWTASLTWSVWQTLPQSAVDAQIQHKLDRVRAELSSPAVVIVVSNAPPKHALMFQLRQHWPEALFVVADRWDTAISRTLTAVDDWADAEFLVVELAQRDSQFRRPAAGWIVHPVGDPRRYYEHQLTVHRVSIQSP